MKAVLTKQELSLFSSRSLASHLHSNTPAHTTEHFTLA